ncbi:MAG: MFS transporter [Pirellulaceae bacterium]|nr:MFS transporter [Pirellulaceae bacterium]
MNDARTPWYRELNRYHWFVLIVAALGWLFDCLDQQLFILARQPAMKDLLQISDPAQMKAAVDAYAGYATSIFLIGWATGGLVFGVLGDRIGRARTMLITILMYSLFTGLSAFSVTFWDFALYRFLTGLGVGGEFAVGVALVAEVMPERARPYALSLLQALSAVGNVTAALLNMTMGSLVEQGLVTSVWRPLFVVGAVPALLALVIRRRLKEPERWQSVSHKGAAARQLGSYGALFRDPRWRKNALIGLGLAFSGVVGLWAVGFFTMDLVGNVLTKRFVADGLSEQEVVGRVAYWKGITSLMINGGAFLGMYSFGIVTQRIGRKPAFAIGFVSALISTAAVFAFLTEFWQIFVLVPIMGFCQLSLFAGYAIYFPELFPTHLRSTGTSFCYNVGRFVAAVGPTMLALLTSQVFAKTDEPLRYAGLTMCSIFVVGLLVLPFAPETKGRPLPD